MSWDSPNSKGRKTIWVSEKHFTKVWNYKYGLLGKKQDFKQKPEFSVPQKRKKKTKAHHTEWLQTERVWNAMLGKWGSPTGDGKVLEKQWAEPEKQRQRDMGLILPCDT